MNIKNYRNNYIYNNLSFSADEGKDKKPRKKIRLNPNSISPSSSKDKKSGDSKPGKKPDSSRLNTKPNNPRPRTKRIKIGQPSSLTSSGNENSSDSKGGTSLFERAKEVKQSIGEIGSNVKREFNDVKEGIEEGREAVKNLNKQLSTDKKSIPETEGFRDASDFLVESMRDILEQQTAPKKKDEALKKFDETSDALAGKLRPDSNRMKELFEFIKTIDSKMNENPEMHELQKGLSYLYSGKATEGDYIQDLTPKERKKVEKRRKRIEKKLRKLAEKNIRRKNKIGLIGNIRRLVTLGTLAGVGVAGTTTAWFFKNAIETYPNAPGNMEEDFLVQFGDALPEDLRTLDGRPMRILIQNSDTGDIAYEIDTLDKSYGFRFPALGPYADLLRDNWQRYIATQDIDLSHPIQSFKRVASDGRTYKYIIITPGELAKEALKTAYQFSLQEKERENRPELTEEEFQILNQQSESLNDSIDQIISRVEAETGQNIITDDEEEDIEEVYVLSVPQGTLEFYENAKGRAINEGRELAAEVSEDAAFGLTLLSNPFALLAARNLDTEAIDNMQVAEIPDQNGEYQTNEARIACVDRGLSQEKGSPVACRDPQNPSQPARFTPVGAPIGGLATTLVNGDQLPYDDNRVYKGDSPIVLITSSAEEQRNNLDRIGYIDVENGPIQYTVIRGLDSKIPAGSEVSVLESDTYLGSIVNNSDSIDDVASASIATYIDPDGTNGEAEPRAVNPRDVIPLLSEINRYDVPDTETNPFLDWLGVTDNSDSQTTEYRSGTEEDYADDNDNNGFLNNLLSKIPRIPGLDLLNRNNDNNSEYELPPGYELIPTQMCGHDLHAHQTPPASQLEVVHDPDPNKSGDEVKLASEAAEAFRKVQAAARADGVDLYAFSGFRSLEIQEQLFRGIGEQRGVNAETRSKTSAPPGFSEHNTALAVDIRGEGFPVSQDQITNEAFAQSEAGRWVKNNMHILEENGFTQTFDGTGPTDREDWHFFYGERRKARNPDAPDLDCSFDNTTLVYNQLKAIETSGNAPAQRDNREERRSNSNGEGLNLDFGNFLGSIFRGVLRKDGTQLSGEELFGRPDVILDRINHHVQNASTKNEIVDIAASYGNFPDHEVERERRDQAGSYSFLEAITQGLPWEKPDQSDNNLSDIKNWAIEQGVGHQRLDRAKPGDLLLVNYTESDGHYGIVHDVRPDGTLEVAEVNGPAETDPSKIIAPVPDSVPNYDPEGVHITEYDPNVQQHDYFIISTQNPLN